MRNEETSPAPRASGLEGPESARYASIARQFYEAVSGSFLCRWQNIRFVSFIVVVVFVLVAIDCCVLFGVSQCYPLFVVALIVLL